MLDTLLDMLSFRRPADSRSSNAFIDRFLMPLPSAYRDVFGNVHVRIGDSPILFSSHTDTVHWAGGKQNLNYDPIAETIGVGLTRKKKHVSNCLGADCTAGVYLMREMILAGVSGRYVFHYAEECGGVGSRSLADHYAEWLAESPAAIAFDRRGLSDVISHQAGRRCCSDLFASELSAALNAADPSFAYRPSDRGIYTDTAEYIDIIPECTNISVGYFSEHTANETQNVRHLFALRNALIVLDWPALTIARDPRDLTLDAADLTSDLLTDVDVRLADDDPRMYLDPTYAEVNRALRLRYDWRIH